jgi:hypothetical protein
MEAKIKFVAVDMPEATPFMLHLRCCRAGRSAATDQQEERYLSADESDKKAPNSGRWFLPRLACRQS